MSVVDIRRASVDDAGTIVRFVRALADYEREPHAVIATEAIVRAQLASSRPPFECLIAELEGVPVGFAVFFETYSTWRAQVGIHLEDLWVDPSARRHGVARALMAALARALVVRGGARLEWSVLRWNDLALDFYRALDAREQSEWTTYRLDGDALALLAAEHEER